MLMKWNKYIAEFFHDVSKQPTIYRNIEGPEIIKSELKSEMANVKWINVAGPDGNIVEMQTALEYFGINKITILINIQRRGYNGRSSKINFSRTSKETRCKRIWTPLDNQPKESYKKTSELNESNTQPKIGHDQREWNMEFNILGENDIGRTVQKQNDIYLYFIGY